MTIIETKDMRMKIEDKLKHKKLGFRHHTNTQPKIFILIKGTFKQLWRINGHG